MGDATEKETAKRPFPRGWSGDDPSCIERCITTTINRWGANYEPVTSGAVAELALLRAQSATLDKLEARLRESAYGSNTGHKGVRKQKFANGLLAEFFAEENDDVQ